MTLRLDFDGLSRVREARLAGGVTVRWRPASYAVYRAAEAAASAALMRGLEMAATAGDAAVAEIERRAALGLADAAFADHLAAECVEGWDGVVDADGAAAPFDARTWLAFRDSFPRQADGLVRLISGHVSLLVAEGNASAASPPGGGAAD